jgi:hypothetical protein
MSTAFTFEPAIHLGKSGAAEFWVYSVEEIAVGDRVEVLFSLGTIEIERWNGSVIEVIQQSLGGKNFWMVRISVTHVPPRTGTPTSSSGGDLVNVSITITSQSSPYVKRERKAVPAIVKT